MINKDFSDSWIWKTFQPVFHSPETLLWTRRFRTEGYLFFCFNTNFVCIITIESDFREFPGSPVVRTEHFQCWMPSSIFGWGTEITSCVMWPKAFFFFLFKIFVFINLNIIFISVYLGFFNYWVFHFVSSLWCAICIIHWKKKKRNKVKVGQSCPTLCNPMDCTVHRIIQARILEWVAFPFSRGSFHS